MPGAPFLLAIYILRNITIISGGLVAGKSNLVNALRSIAVPRYNLSNKAVEPPLVAVRLGEEIFIKGIVNGEIGLTYEKPILYNNRYAQVSLSLNIIEVDPYDATEVFKNGGFRGVVQTLKGKYPNGMNL